MSHEQILRDDFSRLVAGAAKVVARVRYCWLVTETGLEASAKANPSDAVTASGVAPRAGVTWPTAVARPMGRILSDTPEHDWTLRFVTDLRSRKVNEIQHAGTVQLILQDDANEAFVVLGGSAIVLSDESATRQWWRQAYARYFPTEEDRTYAAFVEVKVERMRLWIRGVTPEPFGIHPVELERDGVGNWRAWTPQ